MGVDNAPLFCLLSYTANCWPTLPMYVIIDSTAHQSPDSDFSTNVFSADFLSKCINVKLSRLKFQVIAENWKKYHFTVWATPSHDVLSQIRSVLLIIQDNFIDPISCCSAKTQGDKNHFSKQVRCGSRFFICNFLMLLPRPLLTICLITVEVYTANSYF